MYEILPKTEYLLYNSFCMLDHNLHGFMNLCMY